MISKLNPEVVLLWLQECFEVRPESGTLIWCKPPKNHARLIGCKAGSLRQTHSGKYYCHIKYNRRAIKRGWLIFLWIHKRWPSSCIDHIDGNSTNDQIDNLREATITQNSWNHKKRSRRIGLPMGVRSAKSGKFVARISHHKRQITIGTFNSVAQARAAYLAARENLYGRFA